MLPVTGVIHGVGHALRIEEKLRESVERRPGCPPVGPTIKAMGDGVGNRRRHDAVDMIR